jgi:DNA repair exonuclease SbcCD nuclease subunit
VIRFVHTADWQLGMTRHFFSEGVQERFTQARFDAIRRLGEIATEQDCQFVIVCGDIFESNQVDRRTVARACEALADVKVPVYILPGNHDPLNAASVYRSSTFSERRPAHVHVIDAPTPQVVAERVEIVGAPWKSKMPVVNPLEGLLTNLEPADDTARIVIGHGILDTLTPDKDAPGLIFQSNLDAAVNDGKANFIALGDRHSLTSVGASGRIWYSGTPESTDFREDKSGYALVVELEGERISTREVRVGQWRFIEDRQVELNHALDVSNLDQYLRAIDNKERTVVRLRLSGGLTMALHAELQRQLATANDLFAGFDVRDDNLAMIPQDADFSDLGFSGFAERTVTALREQVEAGGANTEEARDALMLLFRLAEGAT